MVYAELTGSYLTEVPDDNISIGPWVAAQRNMCLKEDVSAVGGPEVYVVNVKHIRAFLEAVYQLSGVNITRGSLHEYVYGCLEEWPGFTENVK